ncbi:MAG: Dna2/Cas4 domain-containing protein [Thermoflexales bacterium]|nr:Dna2/Cas4 domain-containing protein [Thermoflexales bacterium]
MSIGVLALLLLLAGGLAWALSHRAHAASGLPGGHLVSADTSRWLPTDRPLFSKRHHLSGKPDYLLRQRRELIPVELKSARAPEDGPREGHILQLAAYCLLVAETEGRRPTHGIIKYADAAFQVDYTPALERSLLNTLRAMRQDKARDRVKRNHTEAARCASCGYRHACDEQLA